MGMNFLTGNLEEKEALSDFLRNERTLQKWIPHVGDWKSLIVKSVNDAKKSFLSWFSWRVGNADERRGRVSSCRLSRNEHVYEITLTDITGRGGRIRLATYLQVKLERDRKKRREYGLAGKKGKGIFIKVMTRRSSGERKLSTFHPFHSRGAGHFFCRSRFISSSLS